MNDEYIAGFFDGEGSAMILTIRRRAKFGTSYQFRPTIKIAQKQRAVLDEIQKYLGFGHVDDRTPPATVSNYICNSISDCERFINRISKHTIIKTGALLQVLELLKFNRGRPFRYSIYSREDILKCIDIRDKLFVINQKTRSNMVQKYPKDFILSDMVFVDIDKWNANRHRNKLAARMDKFKKIQGTVLCACGCGRAMPKYSSQWKERKYIKGHYCGWNLSYKKGTRKPKPKRGNEIGGKKKDV